MGVKCKIVLTLAVLIVAYIYHKFSQVPEVPDLEDTWWGPGKPKNEDESIRPFKIDISEKIIEDLNRRLQNAIPFHPPLEGVAQNYGMNTNLLKNFVDYWKTKYNWKSRETLLNKYPHFKTRIQGLDIHFMHVKPQNAKGLKTFPILLAHGWPSSFTDFYEVTSMLTTKQPGRDFVFEVIVPSLPGYGFSDGAAKPGLAVAQIAVVFKNLMLRLGYDRFLVHGGDWGSIITQDLAALYPEHVIGVHGTSCFVNSLTAHLKLLLGSFIPSLVFTEVEKQNNLPLYEKNYEWWILESGYMHLHSTKPDTVGVSLRDSPVGLAAYILEKFTTWTNKAWKNLDDGGLTKKWTYDQLLDNIMIYWVTRSATTSVRIYAEMFSAQNLANNYELIPIKVPSACARFPNEISYPPVSILKERFWNLIHVPDFHNGGHFAAFEVPETVAKDIYDFTDKILNLPGTEKEDL